MSDTTDARADLAIDPEKLNRFSYWMIVLRAIGITEFGFDVGVQFDAGAYRRFFDAGMHPRDALAEDLSHAF